MKIKNYFSVLGLLLISAFGHAQINVAPQATVTASDCSTGPCSVLNDGNLGTCGSQLMWINTSNPPSSIPGVDWIEWNWTSTQIVDEMIIHHASATSRSLTGALIQYWDGSSWQNHHTFSNLPQQCVNSVPFPVLVTDRMRITSFQMTGSGQTSNPNFREIELIQGATGATDDMGVVSLDSPNVYCPGTHNVVVTIQNFGANQVDSVMIDWEINGVAQPTYNYIGLIDTIAGSNPHQVQVNLGSFTFTAAAYNIEAWTTMPNGNPDTVNINDTISTTVQSNLPPPSNLNVSNVTATGADVSWNGGSNNSWLYSVVPSGGTPGSPGTSVNFDSVSLSGLNPLTLYDFYVREVCPTGDTSSWAGPISFLTLLQCPSGGYCFTTAGATGHQGPTQADVDAEYTGTTLNNQVVVNTQGIQEWQVPMTGKYRIRALGAGRGELSNQLGASIIGEFNLVAGDDLKIVVGQIGTQIGAGSGGSFVTYDDNTPIIIAGGAGGGNGDNPGLMGDTATAGQNSNGGTAGQGGSHTNINGSGGGGLLTDGTGNQGGFAFVNGAEGQTGSNGDGGFGGGAGNGSACRSSGGGGYSGGGGSLSCDNNTSWGGGGGSYNSGDDQQNAPGSHIGPGFVIFELLTPPAPNDAGVASIDSPDSETFCHEPTDLIVTVQNYGIDLLFSFDVTVEVDGNIVGTASYSGSPIDTLFGSNPNTIQINAGSFAFDSNKVYEVVAYTTNPNGVQDTVNANDTFKLSVNADVLQAEIIALNDVSCHGGGNGEAVASSAVDDVEFFWSVGDTGSSINTLPAGEHIMVVRKSGYCDDSVRFTVEEPEPLEIEKLSGGATCQGVADGFLDVVGNGGTPPYNFTWNTGSSRSGISGLTEGNYKVTVTDSNGCTSTSSYDVVNPQILRTTIDSIAPANCTSEEGFVNLSTTGGLQPYAYEWSDGQSTDSPTGMSGGEYTVTVTDDAGCTNELTLTVPELNTNIGFNKPDTLFAMEDDLVDIEWIDCETGEVVDDSGDKEFVPGTPGSYAFVMTKGNCSATSPCVDVIYTTSIDDAAQNFESVEVFPNPSSGKFNLRITGYSDSNIEVEVLDMQGRTLVNDRLGVLDGEMSKQFNFDFASGIYLLKVNDGTKTSIKRIIIN